MTSTPRMIARDKSRFTYGAVYHTLYDRPLAEARKIVVDLVPEGSSVLDIACGEVPRAEQIAVLNEALRVARKVVIVDSQVPLPRNIHGIALRVVEASGGPAQYRSFLDYLATGGIGGILDDSRVRASASQRCVFWHGCREMVVLDGHAKAAV